MMVHILLYLVWCWNIITDRTLSVKEPYCLLKIIALLVIDENGVIVFMKTVLLFSSIVYWWNWFIVTDDNFFDCISMKIASLFIDNCVKAFCVYYKSSSSLCSVFKEQWIIFTQIIKYTFCLIWLYLLSSLVVPFV